MPPHSESEITRDSFPTSIGAAKLIAVGGGRGGVGKSIVALNLAVYFAQLGRRVVLVDADPTGSNLHCHFGVPAGSTSSWFGDRSKSATQKEPAVSPAALLSATTVPGLHLLAASHDSVNASIALRAGRKTRWMADLRALPADYLVIDVGPGHGLFALDTMLAADIAVAVTIPEPPAIETTYRFVRAVFVRRMRRLLHADRFRLGLLERALGQMGSLPAPIDLVRTLMKMDRGLSEFTWNEANRLKLFFVVNQTRVRTDLEIGNQMSDLAARHYGVKLDELGHIEHDDSV